MSCVVEFYAWTRFPRYFRNFPLALILNDLNFANLSVGKSEPKNNPSSTTSEKQEWSRVVPAVNH